MPLPFPARGASEQSPAEVKQSAGYMSISTSYKEKLPRHLSYPVGLQILATALGEVPQAEVLTVSFHAKSGSVSRSEKLRKGGEYYPVLAARFRHVRLGISECRGMESYYDPTWELHVYAVTREKRATAQALLIEQGIPAIAAWLRKPRSETWLEGRKEITVAFSNHREALSITESSR
jgi:hypothetical protein